MHMVVQDDFATTATGQRGLEQPSKRDSDWDSQSADRRRTPRGEQLSEAHSVTLRGSKRL